MTNNSVTVTNNCAQVALSDEGCSDCGGLHASSPHHGTATDKPHAHVVPGDGWVAGGVHQALEDALRQCGPKILKSQYISGFIIMIE
jgi:hypothetical protein